MPRSEPAQTRRGLRRRTGRPRRCGRGRLTTGIESVRCDRPRDRAFSAGVWGSVGLLFRAAPTVPAVPRPGAAQAPTSRSAARAATLAGRALGEVPDRFRRAVPHRPDGVRELAEVERLCQRRRARAARQDDAELNGHPRASARSGSAPLPLARSPAHGSTHFIVGPVPPVRVMGSARAPCSPRRAARCR